MSSDRPPQSMRQTLVIANRSAATPDLMREVERRVAEQPTAFTLIIPKVTRRNGGDWSLQDALNALTRAAGGATGRQKPHVSGSVTDSDPIAAIETALAERDFDDVILCARAVRRAGWPRRDPFRRTRELGLPVTVITPPAVKKLGLQDLPMTGPG